MNRRRVNVPIMFLSLFLSLMLWFTVYSESLPTTPGTYKARLMPVGLDTANYAITKMPDSIVVKLQGPADKLPPKDTPLEAEVELFDANPTRKMYPVKLVYPDGLQDYLVKKTLSAMVTIERLDRKKLDIDVEGQGELRDKTLTLDNAVAEPRTALVQGPKTLVDQVAKLVARIDLSKIDLDAPKAEDDDVRAYDANDHMISGVEISPSVVRIMPAISVTPAEKPVIVVPSIIGQPNAAVVPNGYELTPPQVTLRGKSLTLAQISNIQTEPIDVSGIDHDTTYSLILKLPVGTKLARPREVVRLRYLVRPNPAYGSSAPALSR